MNTDLRRAAEDLLEGVEAAIKAGDWVVDGACDPDMALVALRQALAQSEQKPLGEEWVPCVKLPIVVHVRNQRDGETHISTREGITPVLPEDLIMRGVAGEEYPIGRELFERTYTFDVDAVNMSQECVDETAKREHEPDDEGLYTETQVQRMIELLERCENEMRYAGWLWYESDNPARNEVYEEVKEFLK